MKTLAKCIEMISWTEEDGKIHPLRFKLDGNNGEKQTYKVQRVYTSELERLAGNKTYKFVCEIVVNNTLKLCELRYELDTCRWILFKI